MADMAPCTLPEAASGQTEVSAQISDHFLLLRFLLPQWSWGSTFWFPRVTDTSVPYSVVPHPVLGSCQNTLSMLLPHHGLWSWGLTHPRLAVSFTGQFLCCHRLGAALGW